MPIADWTVADIPKLTGRIAIVTGGNSGLGLETARGLIGAGARVVMTSRSVDRGNQAAAHLRRDMTQTQLEVMQLDLADLSSVRKFVKAFAEKYGRLDILVNNAGVMAIPHQKTADGFEMQFGTNHLGHFALTGLLMDVLLAAPTARIVTVSSGVHRRGTINFDDLQSEEKYDRWGAYAQSKLANLLFAFELQRKLKQAGVSAISVAAHPGYAATNLQAVGPQMAGSKLAERAMKVANAIFAQSAAKGALPQLYAATASEINGCDYIGPGGFMEMRGFPQKVTASNKAYDEAVANRLWQISEELSGVYYVALEPSSRL